MTGTIGKARDQVLEALRGAAQDAMPWSDEDLMRLVAYQGCRPPRNGTDEWGVTWAPVLAAAAESGHAYAIGHPAGSVGQLLAGRLPDGRDPAPFAGLLDGIDPERTLAVGLHPLGPLDRLSALLGATEALVALLEEAEAARVLLERLADYHVAVARNYLAAGVGAGWLADDYAGANGPLLSPELWRKAVLPGLRRVIETYRAADALVFFHTCGQSAAFIPDLLEAGVTAFNLEQAACDLPALRARFGSRIAFVGVSSGFRQ